MAEFVIPEKVIVTFPTAACLYGRQLEPEYRVEFKAKDMGITIPTMGTSKIIRESLYAVFEGLDNIPANEAELQALAYSLARDYYESLNLHYDVVINGIADWSPEGCSDAIEFSYTGSDMSTRVYRDIQDFPDDFDHEDTHCCPKEKRITRISCLKGKIQVFGREIEFANSRLLKVSAEEHMYEAGCCVCFQKICIDAVGCHNEPVSSPSVTIKDSGGNVVNAQATNGPDGRLCFKVPDKATYTITVGATGYTSKTEGVTLPGGIDGYRKFTLAPTTSEIKVCVYVYGCGSDNWLPGQNPRPLPDGSGGYAGLGYPLPSKTPFPIQGATVDFGGATTKTTDADGKACYTFVNSAGLKAFVVSANHYNTSTYNFTISGGCASYNITFVLAAASGRRCCGDANFPQTWNLSFGGGSDTITSGSGVWNKVVGVPGTISSDVCTVPYSCPNQITTTIAMGINFQCIVDGITNKFTKFHWNVTYMIQVCAPNNVGNTSVPICDPSGVYYNCCSGIGGTTFPLSCFSCSNGCPAVVGTTRNITSQNAVFESGDVLRSSMSEDPWDWTIGPLAGKTIDCTRPGAPSNPYYVPPIVTSITGTE